MLISFDLENWRSFRDKSAFNLTASREKQHSDRLPHFEKYDLRLLPTAAIYGGNASGKSNFFSAFQFAQKIITEGVRVNAAIPVLPFRLDIQSMKNPTYFRFVIAVPKEDNNSTQDECYEYSFAVSYSDVIEEELIQIKPSIEKSLFKRVKGKNTTFDDSIKRDENLYNILNSTRNNQLFLTNAASQNIARYKTNQLIRVYRWFERLTLVGTDMRVSTQLLWDWQQKDGLRLMGDVLESLGTGVTSLDFVDVSPEVSPFPTGIIETLLESSQNGSSVLAHQNKQRYLIRRNDDSYEIKQLVSGHKDIKSKSIVRFDLRNESDGTVRVMDLLPCFLLAMKNNGVFVIDELDHSIHTLLISELLRCYLSSCSPHSRSQIIFTTHDVMQMDQSLLRRDELWVTGRKNDGSTELIPFSSYKGIRKDKSIRTSYLRGQLGGVPRLHLSNVIEQ
ncbi:MAG: ATP-binding protein [Planctomycetaceae bacterium]|jgi:AAA15 family ATPase/GTPase|nr:ATP-binding protein [Planctomycetaceae bacterium]